MCNLLEHSERDARLRQAKRGEPIYASLAAEYGIQYEPPSLTTPNGYLSFEGMRTEVRRLATVAAYIN
jgi:hypothetical protein